MMEIWKVVMDFEDWHGIDIRYFDQQETAEQFAAIIKALEPGGRRFVEMYEVSQLVISTDNDLRNELWRTMEVRECGNCGWYEDINGELCKCHYDEEE